MSPSIIVVALCVMLLSQEEMDVGVEVVELLVLVGMRLWPRVEVLSWIPVSCVLAMKEHGMNERI